MDLSKQSLFLRMELFSSSYLLYFILLIFIFILFLYVSYINYNQDHKLSSMTTLVSTLVQEIHFIKTKIVMSEKHNGYENSNENDLQYSSDIMVEKNNLKLINVSDNETEDEDEDGDEDAWKLTGRQ